MASDDDRPALEEADTQMPDDLASASTAVEADPRSPSAQHLHDEVKDALFSESPKTPLEAGQVFAGRYRLQQLLGQGGMGEVYRAHDLVLDEDVAVKFLPPQLAARPGYYERFVQEVRLARQVSHPSVCRVHDIGEADGRPFISMEYVDGEDLASLLRRIGRLGPEKAVELSHQLCSGLAALHERGIVHRDLKPANVMLDGDGHIRIADFGLASIVDELGEHEIRDGTPAYQAPEQLAGKEVTARSDVYALGLVLRDMFTGRRGDRSMSATGSETSESALDPRVSTVIDRCLKEDPAQRPESALAVSAALPGGDPLAAALAAGRLPSPEAVANARAVGGLTATVARALVVVTVLALVMVAVLNTNGTVLGRSRDLLAPDVLRHRAHEVLERVGHDPDVPFESRQFSYDREYLDALAEEEEDRAHVVLADSEISAIRMRYRGFPLGTFHGYAVSSDVVEMSQPGQTEVTLDGRGRLRELLAIPDEDVEVTEEPPKPAEEVWAALFAEAEFDPATLTSTPPTLNPPVFADHVAAWTGSFGGREISVHAAALRGRAVWFRTDYSQVADPSLHITGVLGLAVLLLVVTALAVAFVALRTAVTTLRRREGDFKGARRVAIVVFATSGIAWLVSSEGAEALIIEEWIFVLAGTAVISWLLYLMLEPYARANWPHTLVSWNRLLQGRWRDPMVGRDLVVGACAGGVLAATIPLVLRMGGNPLFYHLHQLDPLLGARFTLGFYVAAVPAALEVTFMLYLALLCLHKVFRVRAVAIVVFLGFVPSFALLIQTTWGTAVALAMGGAFAAVVMLRYGLLAMAFFVFAAFLVMFLPITLLVGFWHWPTGLVSGLLVVGMAMVGAWLATAPQREGVGP